MTAPVNAGGEGAAPRLEATVVLPNKAGLHARSAALLIKTSARFQASVTLHAGGRQASARSLMELLRLGARRGHEVRVLAQGHDAGAALREITALLENGFGEE